MASLSVHLSVSPSVYHALLLVEPHKFPCEAYVHLGVLYLYVTPYFHLHCVYIHFYDNFWFSDWPANPGPGQETSDEGGVQCGEQEAVRGAEVYGEQGPEGERTWGCLNWYTVDGFIFVGTNFSWIEQKWHIRWDRNLWLLYFPL